MKIKITKPQLSVFLRRRFSDEDLLWIVQEMIDEGYGVESAVYDGIREFIKSKNLLTNMAEIASNGDITIIGLDKRSIRQRRPNF